jgi:two-component system sensor histidine kinase DegS
MMRSQAEQLQTRQQHVREYQEKLRLLIDLLGIQAVPQDDTGGQSIPRGATGMLGATEILNEVSTLSLVQAQEDERLRIAREVNDGATQAMTNLMLRAEICSRLIDRDVNETRTELEGLKAMIKSSLEESRRLVYDLRPLAIEELGVVGVLGKYMDELKRAHGIAGSVEGPAEMEINQTMQLAIFRFVQAIMGAMLVEGGAYQMDVHLGLDEQTARVLIEAIGLESERETIYSALDDESMRNRIDYFGATLTTQIRPNRGMAIEVDVPVPAEAYAYA